MKWTPGMYRKHFSNTKTLPPPPPVEVSLESNDVQDRIARVKKSLNQNPFAGVEAALDRLGAEIENTNALVAEFNARLRKSQQRCPKCHQFSNCECEWN